MNNSVVKHKNWPIHCTWIVHIHYLKNKSLDEKYYNFNDSNILNYIEWIYLDLFVYGKTKILRYKFLWMLTLALFDNLLTQKQSDQSIVKSCFCLKGYFVCWKMPFDVIWISMSLEIWWNKFDLYFFIYRNIISCKTAKLASFRCTQILHIILEIEYSSVCILVFCASKLGKLTIGLKVLQHFS